MQVAPFAVAHTTTRTIATFPEPQFASRLQLCRAGGGSVTQTWQGQMQLLFIFNIQRVVGVLICTENAPASPLCHSHVLAGEPSCVVWLQKAAVAPLTAADYALVVTMPHTNWEHRTKQWQHKHGYEEREAINRQQTASLRNRMRSIRRLLSRPVRCR